MSASACGNCNAQSSGVPRRRNQRLYFPGDADSFYHRVHPGPGAWAGALSICGKDGGGRYSHAGALGEPGWVLVASALTMLFTWLVSLFINRRIRQVDMVESLKSVD